MINSDSLLLIFGFESPTRILLTLTQNVTYFSQDYGGFIQTHYSKKSMIQDYMHNRQFYEKNLKESTRVPPQSSKSFKAFNRTKFPIPKSMRLNPLKIKRGIFDSMNTQQAPNPMRSSLNASDLKKRSKTEIIQSRRSLNGFGKRGGLPNYMTATCTFSVKNANRKKLIEQQKKIYESETLGSSREPEKMKEALTKSAKWRIVSNKNKAYPHRII